MALENEVNKTDHVFTNASEIAIGAAIYCVSVDKDGNCKVSPVTAKSKINPLPKTQENWEKGC